MSQDTIDLMNAVNTAILCISIAFLLEGVATGIPVVFPAMGVHRPFGLQDNDMLLKLLRIATAIAGIAVVLCWALAGIGRWSPAQVRATVLIASIVYIVIAAWYWILLKRRAALFVEEGGCSYCVQCCYPFDKDRRDDEFVVCVECGAAIPCGKARVWCRQHCVRVFKKGVSFVNW